MNSALKYLDYLSSWLDPWLWLVTGSIIFALCLVGISPILDETDSTTPQLLLIRIRRFLLGLLGTLFLLIPLTVVGLSIVTLNAEWYKLFNSFMFLVFDSFLDLWTAPLAGLLSGIFLRIFWSRYFLPMRSRFWRKFRYKQSAESLSDIRKEKSRLKSKDFTPIKFYKKNHIFYGLSEDSKPLYVSEDDWKSHNQKIIGPTQTGKGVHIGVQLDQAIRKNCCTIFVDPKGDKHAVHIMNKACKDTGRDFLVLDLSSPAPSLTWHPFKNGTDRERRSRLHFAFGLKDTGEAADFYKANEREAIDSVWKDWSGEIFPLISLLSSGNKKEKSQRTRSYLGEWLHLPAFNRSENEFCLDDFITSNGVLYVQSSLQDETVIKGTTIFLMDLSQSLARLYTENKRENHLFAVIDEVRFLMTELLADSLSTICGFDAHFAIAYQSILDIRNLKDRNVNAQAVEQSVNINCKQTICYMAADTETAEWASIQTGEVQKSVTRMEGVEINELGGEVWEKRRMLNKESENYIPANVFRMLPPRSAVFYFPTELAKILYTCWVPVTEKYQPEKPKIVEQKNLVDQDQPEKTKETKATTKQELKPAEIEEKIIAKDSTPAPESKEKQDKPEKLKFEEMEF